MADHCYTDHENVRNILTKEYGFEYTGLGDNGEECFKKYKTNEVIYVHPMFCAHYVNFNVNFFYQRTSFDDIKGQKLAFRLLLNHLDRINILNSQP